MCFVTLLANLKILCHICDIKKELEKHYQIMKKRKILQELTSRHLPTPKTKFGNCYQHAILTGSFDFKNTHKGLSEMHIVFNKLGLN